jgi:hypothetical protein
MLMSVRTHLPNFARDKKEWPVYMTIGNRWSKVRQIQSTHNVVMVVLLTILIKIQIIPQKQLDEQRQTRREVLNEILRRVLDPVCIEQNHRAVNGCYNVLCANDTVRHCKPVVAAWVQVCPEYSN